MDTKDLRYFMRVYEEKSINKAARQLFISPQGLSKIIARLEDELETVLFERSKTGMDPTQSGHYLYENSIGLIEKTEQIKAGIQRIARKDEKLHIGFACGVLNIFSLEKLERYREQCPQTQLQWEEAENMEILAHVEKGVTDIGFVIGQVPADRFVKKEIYKNRLEAIVYEGHPYYDADGISVRDLKNEPLVTLNEKFYCYHSFMGRCQDFGFVPDIRIKTMESQLIYRFCQMKAGIGIDVNIHADEIKIAPLHRVPVLDAFDWTVYMVCRKDRYGEPAIQRFFKDGCF